MHKITEIFPTPLYVTSRETIIDPLLPDGPSKFTPAGANPYSTAYRASSPPSEDTDEADSSTETESEAAEKEAIKTIIEKEKKRKECIKNEVYGGDRDESDTYIFDTYTGLNELKEFCKEHIDTYVKEVINPRDTDLDFYITQSWLNVVHPGEHHPVHHHSNNIIHGVFYISTADGDAIQLYDINSAVKSRIAIEPDKTNSWNVNIQSVSVENDILLLFPSWIGHGAQENESTTTDRISISFNVFLKGNIGKADTLDKLAL